MERRCPLGLVDNFINAETALTVLGRALYHIARLRAEKCRTNGSKIETLFEYRSMSSG
jgi:hypothetical protein